MKNIILCFTVIAFLTFLSGCGNKALENVIEIDSETTVEALKKQAEEAAKPEPPKKVCNIQKDIKNDYCGVEVSAYQCKCAFHGEYCAEAGLSKEDALNLTNKGFDLWVRQLKASCEATD